MPRYALSEIGPSLSDRTAEIATEEGVPPALAQAVLHQESGGRVGLTSTKGAIGPMQLMPDTATALGVDPHDPEQNVRGGVRYLKQQLDRFVNPAHAVAAYNAGPGAVQRAGGVPNYPETQHYVQAVLQRAGMNTPAQAQSTAQVGAAPPPSPVRPGQVAAPTGQYGPADFTDVPRETSAGTPPPNPNAESPGFWASVASGFDPRTPEGRRNLAGGAGAIAAGALTGGAGAIPVLAAIGGAGLGGALAETGEQIAHPPPDLSTGLTSIAGRGLEQAGYEALGGAVMWPVKKLGRIVLTPIVASGVGRTLAEVRETLSHQLDTLLTTASDALRNARGVSKATLTTEREIALQAREAARARATAALTPIKTAGERAVESAQEASRQGVETAQATGRTGIEQAKTAGQALQSTADAEHAARLADLQAQFSAIPGTPPPAVAGRAAAAVLHGPAQHALDLAGQAVGVAAETGPPVNIAPVKAELRAMADRAFPESFQPKSKGVDYLSNVVSRSSTPEEQQALRAVFEKALGAPPDHPLPGVLGKLLNAPDEVSFADAHKFKRLLNESVNWASPAKTQIKGMTKGISGSLREAMTGHEPYDVATHAYETLLPLYRRGLAPQVKKQLVEYPEYLVRSIKPTQPTKLQILKDLLTNQAAKGGGGEEGQAAWDAVRSSWIHENVTKGPLEKLPDRLAKLPEDFRTILAGDPTGSGVLDRLTQIGSAYQQAIDTGLAHADQVKGVNEFLLQRARDHAAQEIRAARTAGRQLTQTTESGVAGAVTHARTQGQQFVQATRVSTRQGYATTKLGEESRISRLLDDQRAAKAAVVAARAPTPTETAFTQSAVGKAKSMEMIRTDLARAAVLSPGSPWRVLSILRLLHGPRGADLVQWAAYTPARTQFFVKLMTSPTLGQAAADLGARPGFLGSFYEDTAPPTTQQPLTGADGRRLTRGVVQSTQHEPGSPRLRAVADRVLGSEPQGDQTGTPPPTVGLVGASPP